MFELIFLGTSASAPSIQRGLPSQIIKHNEHRVLLDCGEGTQRQILKSGTGFKNIQKILLTHGHLDHILGLGGLISTLSRWEAIDKIEIYGGKIALERVKDYIEIVVLRGHKPDIEIEFIEIKEGELFQLKTTSVHAFPVNHRGSSSFGFVFEEAGKRPFLNEKAEALQIPHGPWRKQLVEGESVVLPDGRTIHPDEVLGAFKAGTKIVLTGDTGETQSLLPYCKDSDAIIIEATYLYPEIEMANKYAHLTARQAAEFAVEANTKQLILTHISRRYRESDILAEAQEIFPQTWVAHDFDRFQIKSDYPSKGPVNLQ